jgi:IS605 OrfB family transposase
VFFNEKKWIRVIQLQQELSTSPNFQELSVSTAQKVLQLVDKAWKSFFAALADWRVHPEKYFQKPRIPKYKPKKGEFQVAFTRNQCIFSNRVLTLPQQTGVQVKTRLLPTTSLLGVRIIPKGVGYMLEIIYSKYVPKIPECDPLNIVGIDTGLTNLITIANNIGKKPIVVKGGVVKSINQYYNKELARLQSIYDRQQIKIGRRLLKLTEKRNRKINNFFHEVSRFVITWCLKHQIDTIIIGRNKKWKQQIDMGRRINQNFVLLPFYKLIRMIQYKAQDAGIRIIYTREDYTSKCSFLDWEEINQHKIYRGQRITRGLYRSSTGKIINSDVNGGYNIIKKEVPKAFASWETADGIEGVWLHPIRWRMSRVTQHTLISDES